jgi:DNA-binding CsgD family transcriptional regulator
MRGLQPLHHGTPLSPRELQCLQYAAHGMTSQDIAVKLGIAERTANFHFSNLISKLGVLNRHEAIATAVARGLVRVGSMGDARRSAYFAREAQRKTAPSKRAPAKASDKAKD